MSNVTQTGAVGEVVVTQTGQEAAVTVVTARGPAGAAATVDQTIIDGSVNAVAGNAVFDALALKAPLASPTFTGTVGGITASMVGLGNVDNTSDANKPVSTAQQTALNLKANLASPTFTGIVTAPRITGRCDGLEVLCKAGLAISAGQVVYVTGASGNNIVIGLARANAEATSSKTIGISESTLAHNATGYVITEGLMTVSISAPTAVEGDPIWLSPATAGSMVFGVANKPSSPNHIVYLGVVTRKTGNTVVEIYVKIQNGAELDELSDVLLTSPVAGQALMRGATLWENRSLVSSDISDATSAATASKIVLRDATGGSNFAAVGASSVTSSGTISATSSILTIGNNSNIATSGEFSSISTSGSDAFIATSGSNAHIFTQNPTSYIQTSSTFKLFNGTYTTTLSHSPTANRAIAFPDKAGTVAMVDAETHTGAHAFSSTTRPTSGGTGTPAATSLITRNDGDVRYGTFVQGIAATGGPLRVACVGTSITNQGTILATDGTPRIHDLTNGHAGWLEHLTNHRVRLVRRNGVYESATDKTFGYSGFGLTGLTVGSGGVYPLDNAIAGGAEVLVLEGGTNDVSGGDSSATVLTKITEYWTKAVNSGARVIALNIPPMGSSVINTTKRDVITTVNAALPALATSLGVTLVNAYSTATLDGSGFATTESAWDGIHPTPAYAHRVAALIAIPLNSMCANRSQEMIVPHAQGALTTAGSFSVGTKYIIASIGTTNFVPIGAGSNVVGVEFTATGAGSGTGTAYVANPLWITPQPNPSQTGTKPNNWTNTSGFTGTYTAVTDADGTLWQRVRMVQSGSPNAIMQIFPSISAGFAAGDRLRFSCRLRGVSGSADDFTEIEAYGQNNAGTNTFFRAITGGANLGTGNYDPITGLFVSPIFTVPTSTTSIFYRLGFYGNDVTFDIRQFGIFKVVENGV
jgi:lysophospholipase L1-like esterase